jgi:hypothetical protein
MVHHTDHDRRAVGTFPNRQAAEDALNELRSSGFPMDKVSIIAKDADREGGQVAGMDVQDRGDTEAQEGAGIGAVAGTALGGLGGLLVGLEAILIPGVGPFLAAGTVATTLAGAGIGAASGSIIGALTGLGIPEEQAQVYSDRISQGGYLVIVDGSEADLQRAESILSNRGIQDWGIYDTSGSGMSTSQTATTGRMTDTTVSGSIATGRGDSVEIIDRRDETLR